MDQHLPQTVDPRVSDAVAALNQLDDLEIDQHVAVFELAHAKLRGLLTDQGHLAGPVSPAGPAGA